MRFGTPDHGTPSIDAIAEPTDTIQVVAQDGITEGKVLYVNVNGATVLRIGSITGLLVLENETMRETASSGTCVSKTSVPVSDNLTEEPSCPKCGGRMWDNRLSRRNPRAPDFKCRGRSCDGVIWPAREVLRENFPASGDAHWQTGGKWLSPPPDEGAPPHDDKDQPL